MIYLIGKIFMYLLFALGLGVAAGWLWRNLQAAARESLLERALMESRSRLPQMETTVRSREQRLEAALSEVELRKEELVGQAERLAARDRTVAELERACAELRERLEASAAASAVAVSEPSGDELELHPGDPAAASEPFERTEEATAAAATVMEPAVDVYPQEIEDALAATREELERTQRALGSEKRRVEELARERELQQRALEALEQQLDLAREGHARVANG